MKLLKNMSFVCLCASLMSVTASAAPSCSLEELEEVNSAVTAAQEVVQTTENQQKNTALMNAVRGKDVEKLKALLDQGADINEPSGNTRVTPLMWAAFRLKEKMVDAIIEKAHSKIDLSATDIEGNTPIGYVCIAVLNEQTNFKKGYLTAEAFAQKKETAKRIKKKLERLGIKQSSADFKVCGGKCASIL